MNLKFGTLLSELATFSGVTCIWIIWLSFPCTLRLQRSFSIKVDPLMHILLLLLLLIVAHFVYRWIVRQDYIQRGKLTWGQLMDPFNKNIAIVLPGIG